MKRILDQSELAVQRDQLELRARFLRATVSQLTGDNIAAPAIADPTDVLAVVESLEAHVASLESKISNLPRGKSSASPAPASPTIVPAGHLQSPQGRSNSRSLDQRCAEANATATAKRQQEAKLAESLLADVRAGKLTLDEAIAQAKSAK